MNINDFIERLSLQTVVRGGAGEFLFSEEQINKMKEIALELNSTTPVEVTPNYLKGNTEVTRSFVDTVDGTETKGKINDTIERYMEKDGEWLKMSQVTRRYFVNDLVAKLLFPVDSK